MIIAAARRRLERDASTLADRRQGEATGFGRVVLAD